MSEPTSPGFFIFRDQPGNAQRVRVDRVNDELFAFFEDMEPGDEPIPVRDMAGEWEAGFPWQVKS